jgi:hypothetical protein
MQGHESSREDGIAPCSGSTPNRVSPLAIILPPARHCAHLYLCSSKKAGDKKGRMQTAYGPDIRTIVGLS